MTDEEMKRARKSFLKEQRINLVLRRKKKNERRRLCGKG